MENKTIDMELLKLTNQCIQVMYLLRKQRREEDKIKLVQIGAILKNDIKELKK